MSKKQRNKEIFFYVLMLAAAVAVLIYLSIASSRSAGVMSSSQPLGFTEQMNGAFGTFLEVLHSNILSQFGLLLLQIIIILIFARIVGWLFIKMGQPSVIGEILAGIILGPSVFGLFFPQGYGFLFPADSLHNISLLSQFGLIFFMFVIGMELDLGEIKKNLKKSFIISHAGIVIPFILGAILAVFLYDDYAGEGGDILTFSLFVGISLSVTAFPVLARIIQEQGKMKTHVGILSMASAANGDITAWCLLAIIMGIAQAGSAVSALFTIVFAVIYMLLMFMVVRPAFAVIGSAYNTREIAGKGVIAMVFVTLLISSYITEILGLHALFGAFIAGVVMPDNLQFRHMMTEKVEDVSLAVFLPLFFVSSGLSTEIGLLNTPAHWWITLGITLVAIIGKVGGTYMACRVVGESIYNSLYMGILMNTRGLMELVILSMGFQLGILSPVVYAMLVIMTLVTTFMTTPSIKLLSKVWRRNMLSQTKDEFKILFSFGRSKTGLLMLNIVETFFPKNRENIELTGMHMTVGGETNMTDAEIYRQRSFAPIQELSEHRGYNIQEYYEVTDNPTLSIIRATSNKHIDLLLVGASLDLSMLPEDMAVSQKADRFKSRFGVSISKATALFDAHKLFQDKTETFVKESKSSVGVVIDRGLNAPANSIAILTYADTEQDSTYVNLINYLTRNTDPATSITYLRSDGATISLDELDNYDLLLIPYKLWKKLSLTTPEIISAIPTTVLIESRQEKPITLLE